MLNFVESLNLKRCTVFVICFVSMFVFSCQNKTEISDALEGSKWKLVGLYDSKTKELTIIEPADCEECYTLNFVTDTRIETTIHRYHAGYSTCTLDFVEGNYKIVGNTGQVACGYPAIYLDWFSSMTSYTVNDGDLRLKTKGGYLLYKDFATFRHEVVYEVQQLPPNLSGTRWKLERVDDPVYKRTFPTVPVDGCNECFTFTFVTDSRLHGMLTTQRYGIDFTRDLEQWGNMSMMLDADENEVFMGGDQGIKNPNINEIMVAISTVTSFYSINETKMILKGGCDNFIHFKKL